MPIIIFVSYIFCCCFPLLFHRTLLHFFVRLFCLIWSERTFSYQCKSMAWGDRLLGLTLSGVQKRLARTEEVQTHTFIFNQFICLNWTFCCVAFLRRLPYLFNIALSKVLQFFGDRFYRETTDISRKKANFFPLLHWRLRMCCEWIRWKSTWQFQSRSIKTDVIIPRHLSMSNNDGHIRANKLNGQERRSMI